MAHREYTAQYKTRIVLEVLQGEKEAKKKEAAQRKETARMLKTIRQLTLERDFLRDCFRLSGEPIPEFDLDKL